MVVDAAVSVAVHDHVHLGGTGGARLRVGAEDASPSQATDAGVDRLVIIAAGQQLPVEAREGRFDAGPTSKSYNYLHGTVLGGSGYIRVRVSPQDVKVDYVQTYLPKEEDATHKDGMIADSYTIKARKQSPKLQ